MGRLAAWCVALLVASIPGVVAAQEPSPEVIEQARVLYEDGANFYRAGRYLEAEMNFRRVHNLLRAPSVLFDLALTQEKQKKWGEAAANFEIFLRDSTHVARREMVEKRVERLRELDRRSRKPAAGPELGPPEEELELDSGESVSQAPVEPPPSSPGPGAVPSAPAPAGTPPAAAPAPVAQPAPGQPAAPEPEKSRSRWWVWAIVGGAAVAAVAIGVGVGLGARGGPAPGTPTDFEFTYGALSSGGLAVESGVPPLVRF